MYPMMWVSVVLAMSCSILACEITGYPENVAAEIGDNVTFNCNTSAQCVDNECSVTWEFKRGGGFEPISTCREVYDRSSDRYLINWKNAEKNWALSVTKVEESDVGQYRCNVYSIAEQRSQKSIPANLFITSATSVEVCPPVRSFLKDGVETTFTCKVRPLNGASLTYKWRVNGTKVLERRPEYLLADSGKRLSLRLNMTFNNTILSCKAFVRKKKAIKTSDNYLLIVSRTSESTSLTAFVPDGREEPTTIFDKVAANNVDFEPPEPEGSSKFPIIKAPGSNNLSSTTLRTPQIGINVTLQTQFIRPSLEIEDNLDQGDNAEPSPDFENTISITVSGAVAASVVIVVIVFRVYFLNKKGRTKTNESQDAGANETGIDVKGTDTKLNLEETAPPTDGPVSEGPLISHSGKETIHILKTSATVDVVYAVPEKRVSASATPGKVQIQEMQKSVRNVAALKHQGGDSPNIKMYNIQNLKCPKLVMAARPEVVSKIAVNRKQSSDPHQPSQRRECSGPQDPSPSAEDQQHRERSKDDPRKRNVEGLIYADLDLKEQGQTVVINERDGEESVYADIVK